MGWRYLKTNTAGIITTAWNCYYITPFPLRLLLWCSATPCREAWNMTSHDCHGLSVGMPHFMSKLKCNLHIWHVHFCTLQCMIGNNCVIFQTQSKAGDTLPLNYAFACAWWLPHVPCVCLECWLCMSTNARCNAHMNGRGSDGRMRETYLPLSQCVWYILPMMAPLSSVVPSSSQSPAPGNQQKPCNR